MKNMKQVEVMRPDGEVASFMVEEVEGGGEVEAKAKGALDVPRSTAEGTEDLAALARALGVSNADATRRAVRAALELLEGRK